MFVQEENLCVCNKQKVSAMPCNEHINCSDCPSCGGDMFYYLRFLEGYSYQQYHFKQNSILFLLQGEIRIDGLHFPHLIIHNKQLLVIPVGIELSEIEEGLIQMVADFAAVVKQAGEDYSPSIIANYTYDLVKEYNQFYHDYSILREENEAVKVFRLALSENVAKVVRISMGLLGIEVPDRM